MSKGIVLKQSFLITPSEKMFSISAFSTGNEMGQPNQVVYSV